MIYDARARDFDLTASSFSNIRAILPEFDGEVPDHSMVLAAYTMSTYLDSEKKYHNLSLNVKWVAVLGVAENLS
jgi:hypothetical protein